MRLHTIVILGLLIFPIFANAQTPTATPIPHPDVVLKQSAGVYPIGCVAPSDLDMAELCFSRTDGPTVLELGCAAAGPDETIHTTVKVPRTTHVDAKIRCYAIDTSGLRGLDSDNAGLIDFTPPGRTRITSSLFKIAPASRRYLSCARPVFEFSG